MIMCKPWKSKPLKTTCANDEKQTLHNESLYLSHGKHGNNNIKEGEHPWELKVNGVVHNATKCIIVLKSLEIL
jgi:hypothetical protein